MWSLRLGVALSHTIKRVFLVCKTCFHILEIRGVLQEAQLDTESEAGRVKCVYHLGRLLQTFLLSHTAQLDKVMAPVHVWNTNQRHRLYYSPSDITRLHPDALYTFDFIDQLTFLPAPPKGWDVSGIFPKTKRSSITGFISHEEQQQVLLIVASVPQAASLWSFWLLTTVTSWTNKSMKSFKNALHACILQRELNVFSPALKHEV